MGINPLSFVINKKMQKRTFLTAVIATTALATVPAWATEQRKLVVGMDATYPAVWFSRHENAPICGL